MLLLEFILWWTVISIASTFIWAVFCAIQKNWTKFKICLTICTGAKNIPEISRKIGLSKEEVGDHLKDLVKDGIVGEVW